MNTLTLRERTHEPGEMGSFPSSLRRWANLFLTGAVALAAAGCSQTVEKADGTKTELPFGESGTLAVPARYAQGYRNVGEGVFIFSSDQWPESLASFKKQHPQLRVTAIGPAGQESHGRFTSFVVDTETR